MIKNISDLKRDDMFFLLAGPCVIEGEDMALRIAERVVKITDKLHIPYVFKGSYRKANRSRLDSFTGIGDEKALKILAKVFIPLPKQKWLLSMWMCCRYRHSFVARPICWLRQLAPEELSILRKDSSCLLLPCVLLLIKS